MYLYALTPLANRDLHARPSVNRTSDGISHLSKTDGFRPFINTSHKSYPFLSVCAGMRGKRGNCDHCDSVQCCNCCAMGYFLQLEDRGLHARLSVNGMSDGISRPSKTDGFRPFIDTSQKSRPFPSVCAYHRHSHGRNFLSPPVYRFRGDTDTLCTRWERTGCLPAPVLCDVSLSTTRQTRCLQ